MEVLIFPLAESQVAPALLERDPVRSPVPSREVQVAPVPSEEPQILPALRDEAKPPQASRDEAQPPPVRQEEALISPAPRKRNSIDFVDFMSEANKRRVRMKGNRDLISPVPRKRRQPSLDFSQYMSEGMKRVARMKRNKDCAFGCKTRGFWLTVHRTAPPCVVTPSSGVRITLPRSEVSLQPPAS